METRRNPTVSTSIPQQFFVQYPSARNPRYLNLCNSPKYDTQFSPAISTYHCKYVSTVPYIKPITNKLTQSQLAQPIKPYTSHYPKHQLEHPNESYNYAKPKPFSTLQAEQYKQQSFCNNWFTTIILKSKKRKTTKPSRRLAQRRLARDNKRLEKLPNIHLMIKKRHTEQQCLQHYGLVAGPKATIQKNFNTTLQSCY